MTSTSFEKVYTFAIGKCPQLAPKNTHAIHEWLANGFDPDADIIPAIEHSTRHGARTIQSFNYFTGSIRATNERRIKEQARPVEQDPASKDASRAAKLRWIRDSGISSSFVSQSDFDWLRRYEEANGQGA